jgi:hypothetical protein
MRSWTFSVYAACATCPSVAVSLAHRMLSLMDIGNWTGLAERSIFATDVLGREGPEVDAVDEDPVLLVLVEALRAAAWSTFRSRMRPQRQPSSSAGLRVTGVEPRTPPAFPT